MYADSVRFTATGYKPNSSRRPDLDVIWGHAKWFLDCSVTHPCASTRVSEAARVSGHAALVREGEKVQKHGQAAIDNLGRFVPLVIETYGRFGAQAISFFNDFCASIHKSDPKFRGELVHRMALQVQLAQAKAILHVAQCFQ